MERKRSKRGRKGKENHKKEKFIKKHKSIEENKIGKKVRKTEGKQ